MVSIITVVYNAELAIERTVRSVISQLYHDYEYIIIDGNSSDGTMDIINKYRDKINILVSEKDNGVYDAMNKGIKNCSGDWIVFMNAGDTFHNENTLNDIFSCDIDYSNYDVIYGDALCCYKDNSVFLQARPADYLKYRMSFIHQSSYIRGDLAKSILFDLRYKYSADYNMFHALYKSNKKFYYLPKVLSNYYPEGGLSYTHIIDVYKEESSISGIRDFVWFKHSIRVYASYIKHFILNKK